MFVRTQGYVSEIQLEDYINYAHKQKEIELVNLGSKKLYQMYLTNLENNNKKYGNNSIALLTDHKSSLDSLLASYGQEVLVNIKGKQVRRLQLDINQVNYKELQDKLLGDFVFVDKNINTLIIVDAINYEEYNPNNFSTKYIRGKLLKLKKRCHFYKHIAKEVTGKGSNYLSVVWNVNSDMDLLEFISKCHLKNKTLRGQYKKAKASHDLREVAKLLTQIHVKTNIDLDELTFDIKEGIF